MPITASTIFDTRLPRYSACLTPSQILKDPDYTLLKPFDRYGLNIKAKAAAFIRESASTKSRSKSRALSRRIRDHGVGARNRGAGAGPLKKTRPHPPKSSAEVPVTNTPRLPWTPSAASSKRSSSCAAFATSPCRTPLQPSWPGLSSSRMLRRSVVGSPPLLPCSTHHLAWPRTVPTRQGAQRERRARPHQDGYRTPAHERLALT